MIEINDQFADNVHAIVGLRFQIDAKTQQLTIANNNVLSNTILVALPL